MEAACANDNIGYDQYQRTTLYNLAKANGWDISKVGLCETDCSALVAVCCNCAGITVSKDMYTAIELETLEKTGKFTLYKDDDHCKKPDNLMRGDILLKAHHTAVVLSLKEVEDEMVIVKATKKPAYKAYELSGTYKTTDDLNMRNGAGATANSIMITIKKDDTVTCENGEYSTAGGTKWLYVKYVTKSKIYYGFCSSKYLEKQLKEYIAKGEPEKNDPAIAGAYKVTDNLTMRDDAGKDNAAITYIPKDTIITCDGSYSVVNKVNWLYVTYITSEARYVGFCSSKYLVKQ